MENRPHNTQSTREKTQGERMLGQKMQKAVLLNNLIRLRKICLDGKKIGEAIGNKAKAMINFGKENLTKAKKAARNYLKKETPVQPSSINRDIIEIDSVSDETNPGAYKQYISEKTKELLKKPLQILHMASKSTRHKLRF